MSNFNFYMPKLRFLTLFILLFSLSLPATAHKSGPITYQHYARAFRNDVCTVLDCDKNVKGRIEVPYNVSRDWGNWVVEGIELGAFQECQMEEIQLSGAIRTIGGSAFHACPNLRVVELSEGLKFIEGSAFAFCSKLDSINLPNSLKHIGDNAFHSCISLRRIKFGENIHQLGENAFCGCSSLSHVDADYITKLEMGAFSSCESLSVIMLPSIRIIGSWAFQRSGLKNVYLGPHIRTIEFGAFSSCYSLQKIYLYTSTPPSANGAFDYDAPRRIKLYVPEGSEETYRSHPDWKNFAEIIPFKP